MRSLWLFTIPVLCGVRLARAKSRGIPSRKRREAGIGSEDFLGRGDSSAGNDQFGKLETDPVVVESTKLPKRKIGVEVVEEVSESPYAAVAWKRTVGTTSGQDR